MVRAAPIVIRQSGSDIWEDELATYAGAQSEIMEVSKSYRQDMQEIESREAAQELREQMQTEMIGVVNDAGLSVEDYNKITQAIREDEALRQKVQSMQGGS
jgi:hypothetical protein